MPRNPLASVFFISIPENFRHAVGDFTIDTTVLLPVELKPGETELDMASISWEMIISGMLRVLTHQPDHEHNDYYRRFVHSVRPDIESELISAGIEKAKLNDFDMADDLFSTAAAVEPDSVAAHFNRALVYQTRTQSYRQLGNEELSGEYGRKAGEAYRIALEKAPDSPQVLGAAAEFFLGAGDRTTALELFEQLAELEKSEQTLGIITELKNRKRLDKRFQEAYGAITEGREEEAIELIDAFLAESPDIWNGWFLRGWAERRRGDFNAAEESFRRALTLTEPHPDLLNELAICTMENGKFADSRACLQRALDLEPGNVKILSNLGILALKEGDSAEALRRFQTVLELDPEDPIALKYIEFLTSE
jgi:tetratricopeptide (TPR) repeat protein